MDLNSLDFTIRRGDLIIAVLPNMFQTHERLCRRVALAIEEYVGRGWYDPNADDVRYENWSGWLTASRDAFKPQMVGAVPQRVIVKIHLPTWTLDSMVLYWQKLSEAGLPEQSGYAFVRRSAS